MRASLMLLLWPMLVPIVAALVPPACVAPEVCVSWRIVDKGIDSGAGTQLVPFLYPSSVGLALAIGSDEAWHDFWADHRGGAPPTIDFERQWVAAVVAHRSGCCVGLSVTNVAEQAGVVIVTYANCPCGALQAFSEPYEIVAIDRAEADPAEVVFVGPPLARI